ncbi:hypothetical protein FB593_102340 [Rhizobium sp. SJZ105]|nr:hypothetical protein FB593_102340 [Rhizobium sp. SJZ105]
MRKAECNTLRAAIDTVADFDSNPENKSSPAPMRLTLAPNGCLCERDMFRPLTGKTMPEAA